MSATKFLFSIVFISMIHFSWAQSIDPDKDLFYAIFDNDLIGIKKALQQDANIEAMYTYERYAMECRGWRPVHAACAMGNLKALELLLTEGAELNTPLPESLMGTPLLSSGDQPVHLAATYGNKELVEFLLKQGVAIDQKGHQGRTPLMNAIRSNSRKSTALAEFLLNKGAAPAAQDKEQMTPLFYAVEQGKKKIVRLLLDKKAEVNVLSKVCAPKSSYEVTPIFCAIARDRNELLPLLVKHGAHVNTPALQSSPLHQAVLYDNLLAANFLIEHGAQREVKDSEGRRPLDIALFKGNTSMVHLLEKGALPPSEQQVANLLENETFDKFNKKHYPAPAFSLKGFTGKKISSEDLKGKVTLLNIWATWCGPCLKEMPDLQKLKEEVKREDLQIIAVSIDDLRRTVVRFINKNNFDFIYALDPAANIRKVLGGGMPATFIINKKGEIIAQADGRIDWNQKAIRELLRVLVDE